MPRPSPISPPGRETFLTSLTELELLVARRADELARAGTGTTNLKLSCWLQAEQEILDIALLMRVARRRPPPPPGPFHAATAGGTKDLPFGLR